LKNFIIDFAYLPKSDRIIIVELNPFRDFEGNATNAELFDWIKDEKILIGEAPLEFRILTDRLTREELEPRLTKPLRVWLKWDPEDSYNWNVDYL